MSQSYRAKHCQKKDCMCVWIFHVLKIFLPSLAFSYKQQLPGNDSPKKSCGNFGPRRIAHSVRELEAANAPFNFWKALFSLTYCLNPKNSIVLPFFFSFLFNSSDSEEFSSCQYSHKKSIASAQNINMGILGRYSKCGRVFLASFLFLLCFLFHLRMDRDGGNAQCEKNVALVTLTSQSRSK